MARLATYYGISNCKYALTREAVPAPLPFAQSLALNALLDTTPLFADNKKILEVPVDKGYDGTVGFTYLDESYEEALGYAINIDGGGRAMLDVVSLPKHFFYFETVGVHEDGGSVVIKCWILNMSTTKGGKNYTTKGDNLDFGSHEMPITVYGDELKKPDGSEYRDPKTGFARKVFWVTSKPGDADYEDFEKKVPDIIYSGEPDDATLMSLSLGTLTLTPEFNPEITDYSTETTNTTNTITANPTEQKATVSIAVNDVPLEGSTATWQEGQNLVKITVTNAQAVKLYTVTVTKTTE